MPCLARMLHHSKEEEKAGLSLPGVTVGSPPSYTVDTVMPSSY